MFLQDNIISIKSRAVKCILVILLVSNICNVSYAAPRLPKKLIQRISKKLTRLIFRGKEAQVQKKFGQFLNKKYEKLIITQSSKLNKKPKIITKNLYEKTLKLTSSVAIVAYATKYYQYNLLVKKNERNRERDAQMRQLLLENCVKSNDLKSLDYWNKIFENERVREINVKAGGSPILPLVIKNEEIQQALHYQRKLPENKRDKQLIELATEKLQKLQKELKLIKQFLSHKDYIVLNSLLQDRFIIDPDSLSQLSNILPKDVACIQYMLVGEKLIVYFVYKNSTSPFIKLIPLCSKNFSAKKFISRVVQLTTLIKTESNIEKIKHTSSELYKLLFDSDLEKVLQRLKIKKIILNASGIMRYLPFAVLYDGEKYLVEKYQISNVTGRDLIRLAKTVPLRKLEHVKAVIFANPDGSLPASQREGNIIAQLFENKKIFSGKDAALKEFTTLLDVNFIHLATHAKLDSDNPENSYIAFANNEKWKYADMTRFIVHNVDSIVLSACSTAVRPTSNGGEIESMAAQLLRKSPFGSIVASFWDVNDNETAIFMQEYYQHIISSIKKDGTLNRGEALRKAQLKLLNTPATASPKFWAAFTLFGDFR